MLMDRRTFTRRLGAFVAATGTTALAATPAVAHPTTSPSDLHPDGRPYLLDANVPGPSDLVKRVYLNGNPIEDVVMLDRRAGWLLRLRIDLDNHASPGADPWLLERYEGVVTVDWYPGA